MCAFGNVDELVLRSVLSVLLLLLLLLLFLLFVFVVVLDEYPHTKVVLVSFIVETHVYIYVHHHFIHITHLKTHIVSVTHMPFSNWPHRESSHRIHANTYKSDQTR